MKNSDAEDLPVSDVLSRFLTALAPRCYAATGLLAPARFALRYAGYSGLKLICAERGAFWCLPSEGLPFLKLAEGDCIALSRPKNYCFASDPDAEPRDAAGVPYVLRDGLADFGGSDIVLYAGKMAPDCAMAPLFFAAMPQVLVIRRSDGGQAIAQLMREIQAERMEKRPGADFAARRLIDLVMLEVFRAAVRQADGAQLGIFRAMQDPRLGAALLAMHEAPEHPWTLSTLAREAGMSRSGFAERFAGAAGLPPLEYLTRWRVRLAVKRLRDTDESVKAVAASLGFGSASAFGRAFRRIEGRSPLESRALERERAFTELAAYASEASDAPGGSGF